MEQLRTGSVDQSHDPVLVFESATFVRPDGTPALHDITWTVREGETWAVVGPVGSGKSTLAEAILGRLRLLAGIQRWPLLERLRAAGQAVGWPADALHLLAFKEESAAFSYRKHYLQQRFNFVEPQDDLTLDEFLRQGSSASEPEIEQAVVRLRIAELRRLSLIKLSNGQMRRARLARALLSRPAMLLLDDPFVGLDAEGRGEVADLLAGVARDGTRLLLFGGPDAIPEWVTHVLEPDRGRVRFQGRRRPVSESVSRPPGPTLPPASHIRATSDAVLELRGVTVRYGECTILDHITWTVRAGERWAVTGPNGAGKSTLLSLITGDHPQVYANDVQLFGRRRGSGESIWEIKRRIGLLSPELHLYYREPLTALRTAATGFHDVFADRPTSAAQDATLRELFDEFHIGGLAERPFARLSAGEQRVVLLVRALVKTPELLILDEPFQGMDGPTIRRAREWIDRRLRPDQTLLFVTHVATDIPACVDHRLRLEASRVAEMR